MNVVAMIAKRITIQKLYASEFLFSRALMMGFTDMSYVQHQEKDAGQSKFLV